MNSRAPSYPTAGISIRVTQVWVVDCEQNLSAVAHEPAFTVVAGKNETVGSTGDDKAFADPSIVEVDKLKFGRAGLSTARCRHDSANSYVPWITARKACGRSRADKDSEFCTASPERDADACGCSATATTACACAAACPQRLGGRLPITAAQYRPR